MNKVAAVVAFGLAAVVLVTVATAGPVATKQRVAIQGDEGGGFVLTPLTAGSLRRDTGTATFCCWTTRAVVRDGQRIEVTNGPRMTLEGGQGTLIVKNRMEWLDVPGGYALFTGTWSVVRGTGVYARVTGAGRVAGVTLPNGNTKWRREGVLTTA